MLSRKSYQDYVDACRSTMAAHVAAYRSLVAAAKGSAAFDAFEPA